MSTNTSMVAIDQGIWRKIPLALTWLRMGLVPVFVLAFYLPSFTDSVFLQWLAPPLTAFIFALAGITDWLDGWLARRWNAVSKLGTFLDPVADKILVAVALVLIVQLDGSAWVALPAAVMIGREITVSALREWMAESGARSRVAVSWLGKAKTVMQIIAITTLLFRHDIGAVPVYGIGVLLLQVAAVLTLWSMFGYLRAASVWLKSTERGGH